MTAGRDAGRDFGTGFEDETAGRSCGTVLRTGINRSGRDYGTGFGDETARRLYGEKRRGKSIGRTAKQDYGPGCTLAGSQARGHALPHARGIAGEDPKEEAEKKKKNKMLAGSRA